MKRDIGAPRTITLHVGDRVLAVLSQECRAHGLTAGGLAQRIFDAGMVAMFAGRDEDLADRVREALDGTLYRRGTIASALATASSERLAHQVSGAAA